MHSIKSFAEWQVIPQDATGALNPGQPPPSDSEPPTVTMSQPKLSGKSSNYTVTTTATDNVGVSSFTLSLDGVVKATAPGTITVSIPKGTHVLKAEAKDAAELAASVSRTVTH